VKDDKRFFVWWNSTRMHAFTFVPTQAIVGEFLKTFQEFPPDSGRRVSALTRSREGAVGKAR
jgi:hypothetical protein